MKCQALRVSDKTRAWFDISVRDRTSIQIIAPDGEKYYLIAEQVLNALALPPVANYSEIKLPDSPTK